MVVETAMAPLRQCEPRALFGVFAIRPVWPGFWWKSGDGDWAVMVMVAMVVTGPWGLGGD